MSEAVATVRGQPDPVSVTIWDLVQRYCDDTGAREAAVLRNAQLNHGTFAAWRRRGVPVLPKHEIVLGLARALHLDYRVVLDSFLVEGKYLPESAARQLAEAGKKPPRLSAVDDKVSDLVAAHEEDGSISGEQEQPDTP